MTAPEQYSQPVRVLYVDDYPMDREFVRDVLATHVGFHLTEAASREEFEECLAGGNFDLVLSDFNILGFEGLQVIDAVAALAPNVPVMIVTGTGSEEIAIESLKRGAADYVIKTPENIRHLPASIAMVLKTVQLRDECQRAEAALRESEEMYRLLAEHSTDMISKHDLKGTYNYVSLACKPLLGYDPEELIGQNGFDLVHPDDALHVAERYETVLATGDFHPLEYRFRCKDGRYKWIESTAKFVRDSITDEPLEIIAISRDVSARKQLEATLQDNRKKAESSHNQLLEAIEGLTEGFALYDSQDRLVICNTRYREQYHVSADLLVEGARFEDHIRASAYRGQIKEAVGREEQWVRERVEQHQNPTRSYLQELGNGRWLRISERKTIDGGIVGVRTDITESKRTLDALRDRERQQAMVAELGQMALSDLDISRLMNLTVRRVAETLDAEYCNLLELLPGGDRLLLQAGVGWPDGVVGHATVPNDSSSQAGYTLLSAEPVIVEDLGFETRFRGSPLLTQHGVVSGMSVIIQGESCPFGIMGVHSTRRRNFNGDDANFLSAVANLLATAIRRRRVEEKLQSSEQFLRATLDSLSANIAILDNKSMVIAVNAAWQQFGKDNQLGSEYAGIGYNYIELCERAIDGDSESAQMAADGIREVMEGRKESYYLEYSCLGPDEQRWFAMRVTPFTQNLDTYVVVGHEDITERRKSLEQLRQRDIEVAHVARLSNMGEMAAEISHEVNQPLHAISNYAFACAKILEQHKHHDFNKLRECVEEISQQANRAADIVRRVGHFVRKASPRPKTLNVNEVICETVELVATEASRYMVNIDLQLVERLAPASADRLQLQQVLVNIFRNAYEAMQDIPRNQRCVIISSSMVDDNVHIAVHDHGPGLPKEDLGKIFNAFHTSKQNGIGMGLAISRRIVEAHAGRIWVTQNTNEGVTFHVTLPALKRSISGDS